MLLIQATIFNNCPLTTHVLQSCWTSTFQDVKLCTFFVLFFTLAVVIKTVSEDTFPGTLHKMRFFFHPHMQNIKPLAPRNALRTGRSFPYCHPSAPVSTARVAWVRSFVCGRKIKLKEFYKLSFVVRFAACKYYILDFANRAAMETPQSLGCRLSGWLVPSVHQQSASRSQWTSSLCTKFSLGTIGCTCAKDDWSSYGWVKWMGMKFLFVQEMRLSVENVTSRARAMGQSTFVIFFFYCRSIFAFHFIKNVPSRKAFLRTSNEWKTVSIFFQRNAQSGWQN